MRIVALLPMKGNSERIPNKNMKLFNGRPLFHTIMDILVTCSIVDNVIINTDSESIADSAKETYKDFVIIHKRPEDIRGDTVPMNKIIEYDLAHSNADIYIQTHSTSPLIENRSLMNALEMMAKEANRFDSIFSVTKIQSRFFSKVGTPLNHDPKLLLRTQDLDPIYEENSGFLYFYKGVFSKCKSK